MHHVRLDEPVAARVKALAKAEQRTVPRMVAVLLAESLDRRTPATAPKRTTKGRSAR